MTLFLINYRLFKYNYIYIIIDPKKKKIKKFNLLKYDEFNNLVSKMIISDSHFRLQTVILVYINIGIV